MIERVEARAVDYGRMIAGDDLFLLALSELEEAQPARRALAAEGVSEERLLKEVRTCGDRPLDQRTWLTFSPAFYAVHGRAQAFAACLGDGRITPEHVLLALIWDPVSHASQLVWRLGASREQIVEHLEHLGVRVPAAPLPPQREFEWGERVWFDRQPKVLDSIRREFSPGVRWLFKYEGERAFAVAEAGVDLARLVGAARSASSPER